MALTNQQTLVGFLTHYLDNETIVASVLRYDTSLNLDRARYPVNRGRFSAIVKRAMTETRDLFLSTGAASFKKNCGAEESLEFEAVYVSHLKKRRQLPWRLAQLVTTKQQRDSVRCSCSAGATTRWSI
jgi:hypothetical protein